MFLNILLYWLPMIPIAFLNAGLREVMLVKRYGEQNAHQLSTITLILSCGIYTWLIFPYLGVDDVQQALLTGFLWMILTMIFEFGLGLLTKKSWKEMTANYAISKGRLWPLFLMSILMLPYIILLLR